MISSITQLSEAQRAATTDSHKAMWGQFFTGSAVALFMARWLEVQPGRPLSILDPGAGTGILGIAASEYALSQGASSVSLTAVEADAAVIPALQKALDLAVQRWGGRLDVTLITEDFLSFAQPKMGQVFYSTSFDIAIANPPYFKMSPKIGIGGDAPNIYARFMEVAATCLGSDGQLIFIVPRSFSSGLYFRSFRKRFHSVMALQRVHIFNSRRQAFQEEAVLQENVIVAYRRRPQWPTHIQISESEGLEGLEACPSLPIPKNLVLHPKDTDHVIFLPASAQDIKTIQIVRAWPARLSELGLEISTGPVVPFRTEALRQALEENCVPLLWMQHVHFAQISWPIQALRKPQAIQVDQGLELLLPSGNYILLRRFSAKEEIRRLTAAVLEEHALPGDWVGIENHLNYIHCPDIDLAWGVFAILSCAWVDNYFRLSNGNTQVNATDIRALPFPPKAILLEIGQRLQAQAPYDQATLDRIVMDVIRW